VDSGEIVIRRESGVPRSRFGFPKNRSLGATADKHHRSMSVGFGSPRQTTISSEFKPIPSLTRRADVPIASDNTKTVNGLSGDNWPRNRRPVMEQNCQAIERNCCATRHLFRAAMPSPVRSKRAFRTLFPRRAKTARKTSGIFDGGALLAGYVVYKALFGVFLRSPLPGD
jgi:hypothetical protein